MGFEDSARVARFWDAPRIATKPGLKAVELFEAVLDGRVKALWVMGTNPAASLPQAGRVRAALAACDFLVVSDVSATSDTVAFADVVLPAAGWGEKDGTVTNSERRISRQRAFRAPPGEARADWWIVSAVAQRMGWADRFAYAGPAEIFREHARLSAFENDGRRAFDLGALAAADYERLPPTRWGPKRFRPEGRLVPVALRAPAEAADDLRPLLLNTGRLRDQWHTMTRTGHVLRLMGHVEEPFVALHPQDAARLGLAEGGFGRVETRHGASTLRVRVTADQRPGEIFVPMHWSAWFSSAGPVDRLVGGAVDPISGQPELKLTAARVVPVAMRWRGLLVRRAADAFEGDFYWARVPVLGGEAFELAGAAAPPALLEGERLEYVDAGRGLYRAAQLVEGRLEACLFIASTQGGLPPRSMLASMLGAEVDAVAVLAGRAAAAAPEDRTVCACFSVGLRTIAAGIRDRGLADVAAIGAALRAGTNCGSCIPELKEILRDASAVAAA
jgi:assimilatory nitrate reductase catalytic subunit